MSKVSDPVKVNTDTCHEGDEATNEVVRHETRAEDHIRWVDQDGRPIRVVCESSRTHYDGSRSGRVPKRRDREVGLIGTRKGLNTEQAIARARAKALRKTIRRERAAKEWKTLT
jgi:hypothetical protein